VAGREALIGGGRIFQQPDIKETIAELIAIGDGAPATIELGFHLCYGSPADEHVIQPKDAGIMVEIVNAVSTGVRRPIQFFHLPVPKPRTDDAYFAPLAGLKLRQETELYLGLVHRDDMEEIEAMPAAYAEPLSSSRPFSRRCPSTDRVWWPRLRTVARRRP
jgi:hypothetical protein